MLMSLLISLLCNLYYVVHTAPKLGHVLFDPLLFEASRLVKKVDPLSSATDKLRRFLRRDDKSDDSTKKPCFGYEYNDKLCRLLNDRIICGYNKNLGEKNEFKAIDIGNGCHLRGQRVECGYLIGPFINSRRPPVYRPQGNEEKLTTEKIVSQSKLSRKLTTKSARDSNNESINESEKTTDGTKNVSDQITTEFSILTTNILSTNKLTNTNAYRTIKTSVMETTTVGSTSITTTIKTKSSSISSSSSTASSIETDEQNTNKGKFKCVDKNEHLFCYDLS